MMMSDDQTVEFPSFDVWLKQTPIQAPFNAIPARTNCATKHKVDFECSSVLNLMLPLSWSVPSKRREGVVICVWSYNLAHTHVAWRRFPSLFSSETKFLTHKYVNKKSMEIYRLDFGESAF